MERTLTLNIGPKNEDYVYELNENDLCAFDLQSSVDNPVFTHQFRISSGRDKELYDFLANLCKQGIIKNLTDINSLTLVDNDQTFVIENEEIASFIFTATLNEDNGNLLLIVLKEAQLPEEIEKQDEIEEPEELEGE